VVNENVVVKAGTEGDVQSVLAGDRGRGGKEVMSRDVVAHAELGLPSTKHGETRDDQQLVLPVMRSGDVSNGISVVDILSNGRDVHGDLLDGGVARGGGVDLELITRESTLQLSTVIPPTVELLNGNVTPHRDLNLAVQVLDSEEGLVALKVDQQRRDRKRLQVIVWAINDAVTLDVGGLQLRRGLHRGRGQLDSGRGGLGLVGGEGKVVVTVADQLTLRLSNSVRERLEAVAKNESGLHGDLILGLQGILEGNLDNQGTINRQ
jgi:hypothetical protein